jgi:hypothetical protein
VKIFKVALFGGCQKCEHTFRFSYLNSEEDAPEVYQLLNIDLKANKFNISKYDDTISGYKNEHT